MEKQSSGDRNGSEYIISITVVEEIGRCSSYKDTDKTLYTVGVEGTHAWKDKRKINRQELEAGAIDKRGTFSFMPAQTLPSTLRV